MRYEVRAVEYKRTGKPHCPRVRLERVVATALTLEMAIDLAARHNGDVLPEDPAWVTELPDTEEKP